MRKVACIAALACLPWLSAADRTVAITIDDLPVAQGGAHGCESPASERLTRAVLAPIQREHVPVTAFVIAGNCREEQRAILRLWQAAGALLGNHTYSHHGLNTTPIADYEKDILRADAALRETLGVEKLRWFRSPMLQTGPDAATKTRLTQFLTGHGWRQAAVTFDNSDWMFSYVYRNAMEHGDPVLAKRVSEAYVPYLESLIAFFETRSVEVVGREFPQVMLLHANALNAEKLGDVLAMLKRRGYRFVSLETAMADPAYQLADEYAGTGGFSWIHRWSRTKGMPNKGEPDEPVWLVEEYNKIK